MCSDVSWLGINISPLTLFPDKDDSTCATCLQVLEELENIDDDTDRIGVSFVKTQDLKVAERYGVTSVPALLYFEHQVPTVYEGIYFSWLLIPI